MRALVDLRMHRGADVGIPMAEDKCAVPHREVDQASVLDVVLVCATGSADIDGKRLLVATVMGDAAGDALLRALEHLPRRSEMRFEVGDQLGLGRGLNHRLGLLSAW